MALEIEREYYFTCFDGLAGAAYNEANPDGGLKPFQWGPAGGLESRLTLCVLHLKGGNVVVGASSPEREADTFDAEGAKREARQNAVMKTWKVA